ncbi:MAG: HDIG domain-containing protein [Clostridia bacterium]|nr:HDIG domain-containing protein [Clostridia bacterium]
MRSIPARCFYVIAMGTLVILVLFLAAILPQRYDLRVGNISHTTITASKDVVDEISTSLQREEAARHVEPSYVFKENVVPEVLQNLRSILIQAGAVQQYGYRLTEQQRITNPDTLYSFSDTELLYAHSLLTHINLADHQLITLLRATDQQMAGLNENITSVVTNTLNTTIREGYVNESIQYMQQIIGYQTDIALLQNLVIPTLRKVIQPNMVIDQEATAKLQEDARAAVEPVIYKQGQNIVRARERVTANQLEMLRSLGLLDDDNVDMAMYLGGVMLVLAAILSLVTIISLFSPALLRSPKELSIVMLILCVSLAAYMLGQLAHIYMGPALLGAMMLTSLLGVPAGVAAGVSLSILVSALIAGGDSTYGTEMANLLFTTLISSFIAVKMIQHKPYRQQVLLCGLVTAFSNLAIIHVIGFMTSTSIQDVFISALWSAGGAVIASILCVGLDPIIESAFHLPTPSKLLELSNPNHPLLRRLLLEASGTYHHSIIVANLSEAAAEVIGANPLLARASAYFHDIGKLKRPLYFKENQLGENPHEYANPYVSAAIVTAHTRDGLIMAQQNHLPTEIQNVIVEHHGDTPVMFFYHKALQQASGQPVDIAEFRYDGKRPHTKESAIVMLADTIEAAVRSMPDPTPQGIEEFIERLVQGKLEDGQLSDAPITLSDIDKICNAFSKVLNGVFHDRIEYPTISLESPVSQPSIRMAEAQNPPESSAEAEA